MSKVSIEGNASGTGTLTIAAPNTNTNYTLTLPSQTGTIITTAGVPASSLPAGSVLQVVQASTSTSVLVSTATYTDTGLSASITPTSATSKILVLVQQTANSSVSAGGSGLGIKLLRGSTDIYNPSPVDNSGPFLYYVSTTSHYFIAYLQYLDSPATTLSTTYKTQGRPYDTLNSGTARFQPIGNVATGTSTIILMEIAA